MTHRFLPALLALLALAPSAGAQRLPAPLVIAEREPADVMLLRVNASSRCGVGCVVRGAPYAAERETESVQVLADGNRIVRRTTERLYRDAAGRNRIESEWLDQALVQIQDPVGGMSYRLYPSARTGISMAIGLPAPAADKPVAAPLPADGATAGAARVAERIAPALDGAGAEGESSSRSLGTRRMEGVAVEGTLVTTTLPAGKEGNTLPIVRTLETWRSPELKLVIYSKSSDPRYGDRITRIRNLRREEPPADLFEAPRDYTVREIARQ